MSKGSRMACAIPDMASWYLFNFFNPILNFLDEKNA